MARGLAAIHAEGILHRDVRPENIRVREDGTAVISDFGFVITVTDESKRDSTFVGAPLYGSPEQLRGEPLDARSDVFALGLIGHEILTGNRPIGGAAPTVATSTILRDTSAHLMMEKVPEQIAIGLEDLLRYTLAKYPNDRPRSVSVADTLATLREAILLIPSSAGAIKPSASTATSPRRQAATRRVRMWPIALTLSVSATGVFVAFFISFNAAPAPLHTTYVEPSAAYTDAPPNPTDQQLFDRYLPVWKRMFFEKNGMNAEEFTKRITNIKPSINSWDTGISLRVRYDVSTDWSKVSTGDGFLIELYGTESTSHQSPIPYNTFLSEADIAIILQNRIGRSRVEEIPSGAKLKYLRREDAEASLRALTNDCDLSHIEVVGFGGSSTGKIEMRGTCGIDGPHNTCGIGRINLLTGDEIFDYMGCHGPQSEPIILRQPRTHD